MLVHHLVIILCASRDLSCTWRLSLRISVTDLQVSMQTIDWCLVKAFIALAFDMQLQRGLLLWHRGGQLSNLVFFEATIDAKDLISLQKPKTP